MKYFISEPYINKYAKSNVQNCLDTGWISSKGSFVKEFEKSIASFVGYGYSLAVSNGTVASQLALSALNIKDGDEILVPDLTFAACGAVITHMRAKPVFVASCKDSWNMDIDDLCSKITFKTKAILAVHLYGIPLDMIAIKKIADQYGLYIIEDCAQAFGAKVDGRTVGSYGDIACFSFFANKIISTGEGGACLCQDQGLYEKMLLLRDHGMSQTHRYWHEIPGFNYRLTNLQAAIGCGLMQEVSAILDERREIGKSYEKRLSGIDGINMHKTMPRFQAVNWLYSVLVDEETFGITRKKLIDFLGMKGIETRPFFFPLSCMPPYRKYNQYASEQTVYFSKTGLNLPTYNDLNDTDIEYICNAIADAKFSKSKTSSIVNDNPIFEIKSEVIPLFSDNSIFVSVVLPTYNERDNIVSLTKEIILQIEMQGFGYEILVMDDDSPDKTYENVRGTFRNNPNVKPILRKQNRGLSNSIREGIEKAKGQYVLVMDTDYNHDPRYFQDLFHNCVNFDIVIGSRFVYGGGMYSSFRYYASLGFNLWIRFLLKLQTQDNLSGFFIASRATLMKMDFNKIFKVYGEYFFHLLFYARKKRYRILEIPVVYGDRKFGDSKTIFFRTLLRYTLSALLLRFKTLEPQSEFLIKVKNRCKK